MEIPKPSRRHLSDAGPQSMLEVCTTSGAKKRRLAAGEERAFIDERVPDPRQVPGGHRPSSTPAPTCGRAAPRGRRARLRLRLLLATRAPVGLPKMRSAEQ